MRIIFTFLLTLVAGAVMAQCGNNNTLVAGSLTPPGVGQNTKLTYNSGQYVLAYVQSGASYTVSTCGGGGGTPVYDPWDDEWYSPGYDTQLTVYNDATGAFIGYNDDYCGLQSTVSFTATFCGYVRILLHQYSCNGSGLPFEVTMTQNTAGTAQSYTLSAVSSQTNVTCFGAANGTATIQPSGTTGTVRYSWSPSGGTAATATGLAPGTYTVTATDEACKGVIQTFTITEPSVLTASSSQTNATCNGVSNGTATAIPSGGTAPYTYSWSSGGGTNATATGLAPGTYVVTVTDAKGCTTTASATITEPPVLTATASGGGTVVEGGTINLSTGTVIGATYTWSGPNSFSSSLQNPSITNVTTSMAGTYSVTYTVNGCTSTAGSTTVAVQEITAAPSLTTPANAATITTNTPTYTGTATPNSTVRIYVDGILLNATTAGVSGSFSYTQPAPLAEGSHTFYATAELSPKAQSVNSSTNTFLVNTQPTITFSGMPAALSTTYGQASTATQFSVTGTNMQAGVLITSPAGFEVSVNDINYAPTTTLGSSGAISGTVYIRLAASAGYGNYSGNISLSSAGATAVNVAIGNSSVSKRSLTITANNVNKTYGQALTDGTGVTTFTSNGLQNGETIGSVTVVYGTGAASTSAVGTYTGSVTPSAATGGTFNASNYTIAYNTGNITVGTATLNIAANNVNKTYGQALIGGTGITAFTTSGLQNGETVGSVTVAYGTGAAANAAVGTYTGSVTPSAATGGTFAASNYTIAYNTGNIIVGAKTLTITANNVNKVYGQVLTGTVGSTAFTSTGLENGETIGSVTIAYGTGAAANAAVGTYTGSITPSAATGGTFVATNYSISYTTGNIIVGAKMLTITANNVNKVYGQVLTGTAASTAFTSTGLENGETIGSVTVAYGTGAAANAAVGTYTGSVTPSAATGGTFTAANYSISYTTGNIIVGAKTLTITANNVNKVYGQVLTGASGLTSFISTGLENGETIGSVTVAYSTGAAANAAVGAYTGSVTPSAATGGTFTATNYSISYTTGNIVVGAKTLTITANNVNKVYGQALTGTVGSTAFTSTGLENGETIGSVTLAYGTGAAANATVGTYTGSIIPSAATGGTFAIGNYSISYTMGNIIVGAKTLTITANNVNKVYGQVLAGTAGSTAFTSTGLENGETIGSITIAYGTGAAANATVGTYTAAVTPSAAIGGTFTAANYNIGYATGNIMVEAKPITVTAAAKAKTYGDADPALTYSYTGTLVGSDNFSGAITRVVGENVGSYAIEQGTLSLGGNYAITYVGANFVINKAVLTVSTNSAVMCQGNNLPALSLSYSGFRFSDNENSLSAKPTVTTSATPNSAAGTYALIPGGGASGNYTFAYVNGQLTINALPMVNIVSGSGLSVSKGATLQLTATGGAAHSWSNANGIISGQQTAVLTVRPSQTTTYTVTATNANGCSQSATITIEVREDFELISGTNILTPNGDGKNDYLVIRNIDMYPNNEIKIFDVAGRIVYSKKSYDNNWDGTFSGSPLAKGTYYYIIDFGNGKAKRKGFVSIVRD